MAQDDIQTVAEIINQVDQTGDPYYNRFNPATNRTALLFRSNRELQNAELNEQQSIFSYYLGALGNTIAKDGDRQQGMGFVQNGNNITVKDGLVYLAGKVRNFSQQTVTIKGTDLETVGVRLIQSVVTSEEDKNLLGLAPNLPSTNMAGADRLVETVELVANDDAAAPIYKFNNGKLYLSTDNSQLTKINDVVARHNFNSFGSYSIGSNGTTGFKLSVGKNIDGKADYATVNIAAGTAYVQGYEVTKPYASQIPIRKAQDTEQIKNEQHLYISGTDVYTLSMPYVKTIDLVSAQVQDDISVSHGVLGGADYIIDNLVSVDLVYTSSGKQWVQGKDYNIQGNSIIWNGSSGSQPSPGSSYMVKATYNKVLQGNGFDYVSSISEQGGIATIDFSKGKGDGNRRPSKPKANGYITVSYTAYLYRIDTVTLDRYGNFTIIEGKPDRRYIAQPPIVNDPLTLTIGTILLYPNSDSGYCTTDVDTNLTFRDLNLLKKRLLRVEYNEALNSLNSQELQKRNPTSLRGIYTDSFVDDVKFNSSYETSSSVAEPFKANVNMNVVDKYITLPYTEQSPVRLSLNTSKSSVQMINSDKGHLAVAPYTEETLIEQSVVTSPVNVNRINISDFEGILNLTPNADHWETQHTILHYNERITKNYTRTGTSGDYIDTNSPNAPGGHQTWTSERIGGYYGRFWVDENGNWVPYEDSWVPEHEVSHLTTSDAIKDKSEDSTMIKENILDPTLITYMRPIDIEFSVVGLAPYADNLELYFGGVKCDITPNVGYSIGSSVKGSIMALSDGSAKGKFTIPQDTIKCGTVDVELRAANNTAHSSFTAQGVQQNIEKEITPTTNVYWHYDPVAESFISTIDAQITSVDLKFATKSNTTGVTVQLREMSNDGYPTSIIKAATYLAPTDVNVSSDGSVWTKVNFIDPIPVAKGESLAISIVSSSNDYTVWQGKLGEAIRGTKTSVKGGELYEAGVMFESSNNATWSVDQTSDLAFRVNVAKFNTNPSYAIFDSIKNVNADEFSLLATYITPNNTECTWEYRAVYENDSDTNIENKTWYPITTRVLNSSSRTLTEIQVRASLIPKQYVSPIISLSSLVFGKYKTATRGDYVTLNINSEDSPFNRIYLSYYAYTPNNTKVIPQYSVDAGHNWINFSSTPEITNADGYGTKKYQYEESLSGSLGKQIMFHLKLTSDNSASKPQVTRFMSSWTQE